MQTIKDSIVSKASIAADGASVLVEAASDVAKGSVSAFSAASGVAKQRAVLAKERLDAATLKAKRRAGIFFKSKLSQDGGKDVSQAKDPLAETIGRQEDDSETSDSNTSDSVEAIIQPWSLQPSTGTWLLQKPCFASSESNSNNHPVEVAELAPSADIEALRLRAQAVLLKKVHDEENADASMSKVMLLANAEDQAQIGEADAAPAKLRSSAQTCASKVMPMKGGA